MVFYRVGTRLLEPSLPINSLCACGLVLMISQYPYIAYELVLKYSVLSVEDKAQTWISETRSGVILLQSDGKNIWHFEIYPNI